MQGKSLIVAALTACIWSVPATAASVDNGKTAFVTHCASCHSAGESRNWSKTRSAINGDKGGMGYLSPLSDAEISDIAAYLANPNTTDADRLFAWAEGTYPALLAPRAVSQNIAGYYARHYTQSNVYVATRDGQLYFYDARNPAGEVVSLGSVREWLGKAGL